MRLDLLFAFVLLIAFASCEKTTEEFDSNKFGYDYYPVGVGMSWIYDVDSTIYDDLGAKIIQSSSQIKEEMVEEFVDLAGDTIYRIERFWRQNAMQPWQVTDVWVTHKNNARVTRTEENLKFVKFVFPALEGRSWNGHIFFDEFTQITVAGEIIQMYANWDEYELISVDVPEEVGGIQYDQVATVLQTESDTIRDVISRRYAIEKYARGTGLIYKENIILDSQNADVNIAWKDRAEKGFILKQTLVEHN